MRRLAGAAVAVLALSGGAAAFDREGLAARIAGCWTPPLSEMTARVRLLALLDGMGAVIEIRSRETPRDGSGRLAIAAAWEALARCAPYPEIAAATGGETSELDVLFPYLTVGVR